MTPLEHEKKALAAANESRWDDMLTHAKGIPKSWDFYTQLPSAFSNMPPETVHKILDRVPENSSFPFEYMTNLPENADTSVLRRLWEEHADKNKGFANKITDHPNFSRSEQENRLILAADFFMDYEKNVKPSHFATIKALHSGNQETLTDHRGNIGSSESYIEALPHIKEYANKVQKKIMNDSDIRKRYKDGEAYVKVHRGLAGLYGQKIRKHIENIDTLGHKNLALPVAPFSSWSINPETARMFSNRNIEGQPNNQGVVISKWMPVSSIIHSGFHDIVPMQKHAHPNEEELIFEHPTGKLKVNTKEISKNTDEIKKTEQTEDLNKSFKNKAMTIAAAASMLGYVPNLDIAKEIPTIEQKQPQPQSQPHPQLRSIAMIESSGGKNTQHRQVTVGLNKGMKAIGDHGLMPLTVTEVIKQNPQLSHKYPALNNLDPMKDHDKIHNFLNNNKAAYNDIINNHWKRLNNRFHGNLPRMVYAWRNGISASLHATDEEINNHPYVQKYKKYQKMLDLEHPPKLEKTENIINPIQQKTQGVSRFVPFKLDDNNMQIIKDINHYIKTNELHNLSHEGHFTHSSFVAGFDPSNSWLLKVDVANKPGAKSANKGSQAIKEYLYYKIGSELFGLKDYLPQVVLGYIEKDGRLILTSAIRLLSPDHTNTIDLEKKKPGSIIGILDKFRQNGTLHKLAAMAWVLGDVDQHGGNFMTNGNDIWSIDHGTSFADDTFNTPDNKKTFIPYILRAGRVKSRMSPQEKLELMPMIDNKEVLNNLKYWIFSLDSNRLEDILNIYQIPSEPIIKRLNELKEKVKNMPADYAINSLWVLGAE